MKLVYTQGKKKKYLKAQFDELENNSKIKYIRETCVVASVIIKRVSSLEII